MKYLYKKILLVSILITFPLLSKGQDPIKGLIPTFYSITPAIDLEYQGKNLDPELAHHFAKTGKVDLSKLNPLQDTNLWSDSLKEKNDILLEERIKEVNFHGKLASRLGIFRFSAITENKEMLNFTFGKKIHNFLLRKNLLRKLGYNIPSIQYLNKIKINFENTIDRDIFIADLSDQTMAAAERFILDKQELSLTLIDGLAMEGQSFIYNLALGTMPGHLVQGRRIIRSAYIPLALVDIPESINMMPWQAGRIILKNIKLYHGQDLTNTYGPSYEDAKWITRKISKLNRSDWKDIISRSFYPEAVAKLLLEKIISRRNHLNELFLEAEPLNFDPLVSHSDELKDGELLKENFEGYVDRFSFGDPESPFSIDEMSYFFMSKLIGTSITNLVSQFNSMPYISVDEQAKVKEHVQNMYEQNGLFYESPLKAWFFPTAKGQIIVSRDIVTGSYMGTNNQVQLVDTVGGFVEAGAYMGIDGLEQIGSVSGKGALHYQRSYSHVKPIKTLKMALKEPFKNMLVPVVLNKLGSSLDSNNPNSIKKILKNLKENLSVGESFIITDSLGGSLSLDASVSISSLMWLDPKALKTYAQIKNTRMIIKRIHITRSDENTIQVYNDLGKSNQLAFTFKLNSYVPILSVSSRKTKGKAKIEFYSVNLNDHQSKLKLNLKSLKDAMSMSNTSTFRKTQTPYEVKHDYKEKGSNLNLFIWEKNKIKSYDEISITHPKGGTKQFIRQYNSITKGRDIEGYVSEAVSNIIDLVWDQSVIINQTSLMNPGYSIFGKASNEVIITEAQRTKNGIKDKYTMVKILHNGWKANKQKLFKIIKKLNNRFETKFFQDTALQNTKNILLYQVGVDLYISSKGHTSLLQMTKDKFKKILTGEDLERDSNEKVLGIISNYMYLINKIKINEKKYPEFAMKKLNTLIQKLIQRFSLNELKKIFGEKGILVTAKLEGFRQGDERGDSPLISDTYGFVDSVSSPLTKIVEKTNIAQGELMLNWMMERAL